MGVFLRSKIKLTAVSRTYAQTGWRLGPVSFSIAAASMVGIVGPNGSGKSTLLRILARHSAYEGSIDIFGRAHGSYTPRAWARLAGYLPQMVTIDFSFSVEEVVAFGRYAHVGLLGFGGAQDRQAVELALRATAVERLRARPLQELSGGERQRVLLASVLAQQPRLLLLDEPTAALDLHHQVALCDLLRQCRSDGMTVILSTHDLTLAAQYCDHIVLLHDGRIKLHGTPEAALQQDILDEVYDNAAEVVRHPHSGCLIIVPRSTIAAPTASAARPHE